MQTIEICGDSNYPPFVFLDNNGKCSGFNTDITKCIAEEMGFDVTFKLMEWTRAIEYAKSGRCQAIQGMSISNRRKKEFNFSKEYITVFHSVFTLREREDIASLNDLSGLKIAVQEDDISYDTIKKISRNSRAIHVISVSSQEVALQKLFHREVDAIAGNRLTIMYFAKKQYDYCLLKSIGEPINITKFGVGFAKNRSDLLSLFNQGVQRIKENGKYKKIYDKWFGQQIDYIDNQIIENVGTGVICINSLGNITAMNNSASIILNIEKEKNLFKSFYESELTKFIDIYLIQEVLYDSGSAFSKQVKYNVNGSEKVLKVNMSPLLDYDNNVIGVIINFRDITKEKRMDEALRTQDKMQSLGMLISNVAHEIRNPFTSIKNFINLIPDNIDDEEFRESLLIHVPQQIDAIDSILKELLEYSSPKSPVISLVKLKPFINSILKITKSDKNINYIEEIPEDIEIKVDEKHLRQILINIIINAIESIEENGNIFITANKEGNLNKIVISDNGAGISQEDLNRIFDPFFTTKETGTGLGLYITYQLIKENNGEIEIESSSNGTKVSIIFP